jgi:hypothetical protein
MTYQVGQKICLWQVGYRNQPTESPALHILKEVIVTITETKIGVPGEFSQEPVSSQSLRGLGDDGKTYEKHWDSWPESQTNCFTDSWSMRDDGAGGEQFWTPMEAVYVYDAVSRHSKHSGDTIKIVIGASSEEVKPKGDISYCAEHDRYWHRGTNCLFCEHSKKAA